MHIAEVVIGVDAGHVNVYVADGMCAVDDGDDVVGAEQARELCDGEHDGGVGGYVADDAASDVEGGGVGLQEGSQGFDEGGVALDRPLRMAGNNSEDCSAGGHVRSVPLACTGTVTTLTPRRDVSQV